MRIPLCPVPVSYTHLDLCGTVPLSQIGNAGFIQRKAWQRRKPVSYTHLKAVAEKYHGAMEVRTDGEKFTLSVLLIIPQQSESISQQVC